MFHHQLRILGIDTITIIKHNITIYYSRRSLNNKPVGNVDGFFVTENSNYNDSIENDPFK